MSITDKETEEIDIKIIKNEIYVPTSNETTTAQMVI